MTSTNHVDRRQGATASAPAARRTLSLPGKPAAPAMLSGPSVEAEAQKPVPAPAPAKAPRLALEVDGVVAAFRWPSLSHILCRTPALSVEARLVGCALIAHAVAAPRRNVKAGQVPLRIRSKRFIIHHLASRLGFEAEALQRAFDELIAAKVLIIRKDKQEGFHFAELMDGFIVDCHREPKVENPSAIEEGAAHE